MKEIIVNIERGNDGTYGAYIENNSLPYGLIGDGATVDEAMQDFYNSYEEMRVYYKEENKEFEEAKFIFKYDIASFLSYYSNKLSLAGLQRITGINQGQLSHYITGRAKPSKKTTEKIEKSLHEFADEIRQLHFV